MPLRRMNLFTKSSIELASFVNRKFVILTSALMGLLCIPRRTAPYSATTGQHHDGANSLRSPSFVSADPQNCGLSVTKLENVLIPRREKASRHGLTIWIAPLGFENEHVYTVFFTFNLSPFANRKRSPVRGQCKGPLRSILTRSMLTAFRFAAASGCPLHCPLIHRTPIRFLRRKNSNRR